eukprot:364743-Chlamydomonas_euryale.AAC.66
MDICQEAMQKLSGSFTSAHACNAQLCRSPGWPGGGSLPEFKTQIYSWKKTPYRCKATSTARVVGCILHLGSMARTDRVNFWYPARTVILFASMSSFITISDVLLHSEGDLSGHPRWHTGALPETSHGTCGTGDVIHARWNDSTNAAVIVSGFCQQQWLPFQRAARAALPGSSHAGGKFTDRLSAARTAS